MVFRIDVSIEIEPFLTPNFVRQKRPASSEKQEDGREMPAIPIKELDAELLSRLCDDFRENVFAKALKQDPRLK